MHTQNVNVKTAAQESTGRWGELPRMDGFVRNLYSKNTFDVIRADVLIQQMEKTANRGCGLYYEIYEYRLLSHAMRYLQSLPASHRLAFIRTARLRGIRLFADELKRSEWEYDDLMAELAQDN